MKFEEVLPALREGSSIRHVSWPKEYSVYMKDGCLHDQQCRLFDMMNSGMINWLSTDGWKIVAKHKVEEPEPDWEYIIQNKCLCWFWDYDKYEGHLRVLAKKDSRGAFQFTDAIGTVWEHCRPVRKDEVTFYEDKEDEDNS